MKSTVNDYGAEIQQDPKQGAEYTEINNGAKCDEQFKSLTLGKGRGDDYGVAKRQFESLTSTISHEDRSEQVINKIEKKELRATVIAYCARHKNVSGEVQISLTAWYSNRIGKAN